MKMSIDEATLYMELYKRKLFNSVSDLDKDIEAYDTAIETMRKYQLFQVEYTKRLRADMAAMLTDLSMEIGEIEDGYVEFDEENKRSLTMIPLESVERLIDKKINRLKED